jgi:REP element-mobilizing transposase RayT
VPQSLAQVLVHLIFSTKSHEPLLSDDIRPELHPYMATILKGMDSSAILINSVEDHAHILLHLSKTHALCDVIENVKKDSSKWIKSKGRACGQSNVAQVVKYIEHQKEHHRRRTFQEEFRAFLERDQVPYDERYVWD